MIKDQTNMALAPLTTFSNCFDQVDDACLAIQRGDANKASTIVRSLQNDAKILRRESQRCYDVLQCYSQDKQQEIENITGEINDLYQQERDLEKQKRELESQRQALQSRKDSEAQSLNEAQSRYDTAERERDKAQEEVDRLKTFWWVPIFGQILLIRELVEDFSGQAQNARRDMNHYQTRINEAEQEIANTGHKIREVRH